MPLKVDNTPTAIVLSVAVLTGALLVGFLVWSGWDAAAIAAFVTLAAGVFAGQLAGTRRTAQVDAKQDHQVQQLNTIARQTNGDLKRTVAAAVEQGIARAVIQYRREQQEANRGQ